MHKNLCTSFLTMAENANNLHQLLVSHAFLTKKQKLALSALRESLIAIVRLNAAGTRPTEIEQDGVIAVEDFVRYRAALEVIYKDPCLDPEANAAIAQAALHPEEVNAVAVPLARRSGMSHNT